MARLIAALLCLFGSVASAQVWVPARSDDGHFIYHTARAGAGVAFACYAPSQQGKSAWDVGAHEVEATPQGMIRLEFDLRLIPATGQGTDRRGDVTLWVDQVGYRLPEMQYSDFDGYWGVPLHWDDALFAALRGAGAIVLAPGNDPAWQLPVTGIAQALEAVRTGCAADWSAGQPARSATVSVPPQIPAHVTRGCGGAAPVPIDALQAGDLDRDGAPDFVLNWGAITCPGAVSRPFCGAANCSHDVFLSSRGYANPTAILGTGVDVVAYPDGRLALQRVGTFSLCGATGEFCAAPLVWDGASFSDGP